MNLTEAHEFSLLESRNQSQHSFLFAELQMVLETDEVVAIGEQVFLAKLHNRPRLSPIARITQPNRFHWPVAQRVTTPSRELFDWQTSFEVHRLLELVQCYRVGRRQRVIESIVLFLIERAVQVVVAALVVARCAKRDACVDRLGIDDRRDRVVEVEVPRPGQSRNLLGERGRRERSRRNHHGSLGG